MRPDDQLLCHACSAPTFVVVKGPTELGESRDFVLVNATLSARSQLAEGEEAWSATLRRDRDGELVAVPARPGERLVRRAHRASCEYVRWTERPEGFPGLPQIAALVRAGWEVRDVADAVGVPWVKLRATWPRPAGPRRPPRSWSASRPCSRPRGLGS